MDMTRGVIWKQLLFFALPLLAGNIFQQFYNTVDSIVVGNYVGANALGAVTSVGSAINTLIGFFMGLSTGASVVISQFFGAKSLGSMRKAIHTALVTTILFSLVIGVLGYLIAPTLLHFMKTPKEVYPDALTYLRIYFSGILGLMLYNMGSAILNAVGDSRRPLFFLVLSSILNIFLDLFFVIKLHLGVAGVAYATILSQFISDILILLLLFHTKECYRITWKEMRIDGPILKRIFVIGIPAGVQSAVTAFSNVFVQSYINAFGAASTSGWGAYGRVDSFVILPLQSIGLASTTFVGQNAGAGNVDRIKKGIRTSLLMAVSFTLVLCTIVYIRAPEVVSLFNKDAAVLAYGTLFIRLNMPFDFLCCSNQIHAGALRGMGNAKTPMFIMLGSFVLFRQIYLFVVSHLTASIYPVAWGYPAGWLVCSILMHIYFTHSGWEKKVTEQRITE